MHKIDELLKRSEDREAQVDLTEKEIADLKLACRQVFTGPNGKVIAKAMMKLSGIYKLNKNLTNPAIMAAERGKEFMYLFFVKGMLTPEEISAIERGSNE